MFARKRQGQSGLLTVQSADPTMASATLEYNLTMNTQSHTLFNSHFPGKPGSAVAPKICLLH